MPGSTPGSNKKHASDDSDKIVPILKKLFLKNEMVMNASGVEVLNKIFEKIETKEGRNYIKYVLLSLFLPSNLRLVPGTGEVKDIIFIGSEDKNTKKCGTFKILAVDNGKNYEYCLEVCGSLSITINLVPCTEVRNTVKQTDRVNMSELEFSKLDL